MKLPFAFILALTITSDALASKYLVLRPKVVTYLYDGNHLLTIKATKNGDRLALVEIANSGKTMSVPLKELSSIENPVLNNVQVTVGTNSKGPSTVTIGYGAHHCYNGKCPREVSYNFANGKYVGSIKTINSDL